MTPDKIAKALERLRGDDELLLYVAGDYRDLAQPLAALIEAAAKPWHSEGVSWCRACARRIDSHFDDCALIQLVDAINGE